MKVKRLIELLKKYDGNDTVYLGTQMNYPMEYEVFGVVSAKELFDEDEDHDSDLNPHAVFIVEGGHMAYGNRVMWDKAHR